MSGVEFLTMQGYLSSFAPVIAKLRHQGMWLTDKVVNDVLRLAGE